MSKRFRLAGVLAAGLALTIAAAPVPAAATVTTASAAHFFDPGELPELLDAVVAAGAPGAFIEVRTGHHRWSGASGVADLDRQRPMKPWLRHRVASITKTFVATTMLQLVEEERLGLDDPIRRWLPDLIGTGSDSRITVRMLLNHTSGIGDHTLHLFGPPETDITVEDIKRIGTTKYEAQELAEIGLALPRTNPPGESHSYSNTNYVLAGLVIESVTGRDAAAEITRRIIRPLGLRDTYFSGDQRKIRGPHAAGYIIGVDHDFSVFRMSWLGMAGELVSSAADLNRFYRALLSGRLLAPEQLEQMRATVPLDPALPEAGGYGLGLYWLATPCGTAWGHDGLMLGYSTISWHSEDSRQQVTFGMNISHYGGPDEPHPIDLALLTLMFDAFCPDSPVSTRSAVPLRWPWPVLSRF